MDNSIPKPAGLCLDFIGAREAPKGYGTIYGNNQDRLSKPLTAMTINEVIASQSLWSKRYGSSASGRYQFMQATLKGLKAELKLTGKELLDADMQDRLGFHLLERRGYSDFMAGKISRSTFGLHIAQEWASFPVLENCMGAHRRVARGETYYAGDHLNKALIGPVAVENLLDAMKAPSPVSAPKPVPATPQPPKAATAADDPVWQPFDFPVSDGPDTPGVALGNFIKTLWKGIFK